MGNIRLLRSVAQYEVEEAGIIVSIQKYRDVQIEEKVCSEIAYILEALGLYDGDGGVGILTGVSDSAVEEYIEDAKHEGFYDNTMKQAVEIINAWKKEGWEFFVEVR